MITLTTRSVTPLDFAANTGDAKWLLVDPASGQVSAGKPASVVIYLSPNVFQPCGEWAATVTFGYSAQVSVTGFNPCVG